jgi:uroporphyrinogen-III synthase
MKQLQNKRIVITRPRKQAQPFAEKLRLLGAEPIVFPTIAVSPVNDTSSLDQALYDLASYDWMVLSSVNAVESVWARLEALQIQELPQTLKIAAVGPKTATSLSKRGVQPNFVPEEYKAEAMLSGLGNPEGRWVLLPTADLARDVLPDEISKTGGVAHVVTAYHTIPTQPDQDGLLALKAGVNVITFTSPSTVTNFITLLEGAGLDPRNLPGNPIFACIGPITAGAAHEQGLHVDIQPEEYTQEGLISVIQDYFNPQ